MAQAGANAKDGAKQQKKGAGAADGAQLDSIPAPAFWVDRIALFEQLYAKQLAEFEARRAPIEATLPDGKKVPAESWKTTPLDIAKGISNSLAEKVIVAKVNGELWDLARPLEGNCTLELLDWEDGEARRVFWHSSSHVLGYALERVYECKLSYGPPLEEGGFFYEGETNKPVTEADYPAIQAAMQQLVKAKAPYQRLLIKKDDALRMFGYNTYKAMTLAKKVPEDGVCTVYRCGELIDPCRGPHVVDTGRIKAFAVTKNSSAYFQGDAANAALQRVYAISFPKETLLKEWQAMVAEAAKRDHRVIGKQQDLFLFHEVSPGSCFWTPFGTRIYNALIAHMRAQYRRRGFDEVITPNMYNAELWKCSGHWNHYADNMFQTTVEHEAFALKPMNCPGHCMMFASRPHSYKELPIRMADFGVLHRNELSGALTGLTRVRRFQQDDAHIFCRLDQVGSETANALAFLNDTYGMLGFNFYLKLSTRPENYLGTIEQWNRAEAALAKSLNEFCAIPESFADPFKDGAVFTFDGKPASVKKLRAIIAKAAKAGDAAAWQGPRHPAWEENPGDGAFYGPKIDVIVEDALKRKHQCATIQLDFNLPERFGLKFILPAARAQEAPVVAPTPAPAAPVAPAPAATAAAEQKSKYQLVIDRTLQPNEERPVMIHRAILGSVERCVAILCEHYGGKWPLWLSPRQVVVIPVSDKFDEYALQTAQLFHAEGFHAEADVTGSSLDKKVRNAQLAQWNFILVVGQQEQETGTVNVRTRDNTVHGAKKVGEAIAWLKGLVATNSRDF